MLVKPGSVYQSDGVDFIVAVERIGDEAVQVRLINVVNWIVLTGYFGKPLANGDIDVPDLSGELVADSVAAYFSSSTPTQQMAKGR